MWLQRKSLIPLRCFILSESDSRLRDMSMRICCRRAPLQTMETRENFSMAHHLLKQVLSLGHQGSQQRPRLRPSHRSIRTIPTSGTPSRRVWATKLQPPSQVARETQASTTQWKSIMTLTKISLREKTQAAGSIYQTSTTWPWIRMNEEAHPRRSIRLDLSSMQVSLGPPAPKCNNQRLSSK